MDQNNNHQNADRQFTPYSTIDALSGIYQKVGKSLLEVFRQFDDLEVLLGFGSFWQNPIKMRPDSDVDLFALVENQPSPESILRIGQMVQDRVQPLVPIYEVNPHLFVGNPHDIANGAENFIRCLTIHDPALQPPVLIYNKIPGLHLLECMDRKNISAWFREALFSIQRHLNTSVLKYGGGILENEEFRRNQQKFLQRYVLANKLAWIFFGESLISSDETHTLQSYMDRELSFTEIFELIKRLKKAVSV